CQLLLECCALRVGRLGVRAAALDERQLLLQSFAPLDLGREPALELCARGIARLDRGAELCKLGVTVGQALLQIAVRGLPLSNRVLPLRQIFVAGPESFQLVLERRDALRLLREPLLEL